MKREIVEVIGYLLLAAFWPLAIPQVFRLLWHSKKRGTGSGTQRGA